MTKPVYKKIKTFDLIKMAQNQNSKALEELIKRVQKHVFATFNHLVIKKEDVSDLTQEALLKMARSIYSLKDVKSFNGWLNQIVTNVFYDYSRKFPQRYLEMDEEEFKEIKDKFGCEPGEKCIFAEIEKIVRSALMTLPKDLRISLILREYEGLSYQDIAQLTNSALGTVKSRISRARMKLQSALKDFI